MARRPNPWIVAVRLWICLSLPHVGCHLVTNGYQGSASVAVRHSFVVALGGQSAHFDGVGDNPRDSALGRRWFEGHIDELRFWNRALTDDEIRALE